MISEVPKYFPSENRCILDVHNNINYLFSMIKRLRYRVS